MYQKVGGDAPNYLTLFSCFTHQQNYAIQSKLYSY